MPTRKFSITRVKSAELHDLCALVCDSLAISKADRKGVLEYWQDCGISNIRVVRDGGHIVGGLQMTFWGHYFGGRSVDAAGIAYVGVLPEYRRRGAASYLMAETMRELRKDKVAISTLFPANIGLYRKAGYEIAIERVIVKITLADISCDNMSLDIAPLKHKRAATLKAVWEEFAIRTNGNIARTPSWWKSVIEPWWMAETETYVFKRRDEIEGYIIISRDDKLRRVNIVDMAVLTRDAAERALSFLGGFSSIYKEARYAGAFIDPVIQLLPEKAWKIEYPSHAMLRLVTLPAALSSRGYPKGLNAELHFNVEDDVVPENNGPFVLTVDNGVGKVKRGGKGRVKIDVRSLAQLYTGFMLPHELVLSGRVVADEEDILTASAVFAGPRPWVRDDF